MTTTQCVESVNAIVPILIHMINKCQIYGECAALGRKLHLNFI